jgi:hypothetical protein
MHLEGPWLSTGGKRKGKLKFRNADEARRSRELDESWKQLQKKWDVDADEKKRKRALAAEPLSYNLSQSIPAGRETSVHIKSLNTGAGVAALAPAKVYTGDKIKGIGTMHKSNAVPIFSDEQAVDIANMRR